MLAHMQLKGILCASATALYLPFFVFGKYKQRKLNLMS
jgi:hypothetical protein